MNDTTSEPPQVAALSFIKDEVAAEDAFGSHSRLAGAVADTIQNDATLKVIGLLGPWGSGKSTVLKFIQKRLAKHDAEAGTEQLFFVYDAWVHQSDPPRRSFLQALIQFLISSRLTTKAIEQDWQLKLDQLNRQVEDSETTSTPVLTPSGRLLLASLLLVPIGLQLIGHDWFGEVILELAGRRTP